jgi:hypothetical protein
MNLKNVLLGDVQSSSGTLSVSDLHGLLRTVALGLGALVVDYLIKLVPGIDFGVNSAVVVTVTMAVLELARRFFASAQQ